MAITCVMRHAWTHKRQMSGPTVHSYTMTMLNNIVVKIEQCPPPPNIVAPCFQQVLIFWPCNLQMTCCSFIQLSQIRRQRITRMLNLSILPIGWRHEDQVLSPVFFLEFLQNDERCKIIKIMLQYRRAFARNIQFCLYCFR